MLQQLPTALLLFAAGGWAFVFWGVCARVTAGVFGHWLIGYFAHNQGGMHHVVEGAAVQGRNIPPTSLLTMGECWHNNHHAFPGSARLGLYAGEWDPGWWMLLILHKARLVWGLQLPSDLPARSELRPLDEVPLAVRPSQDVQLASVWSLCVSTSDRSGWRFEGPAAVVPARLMRWLIGPSISFRRVSTMRRLTISAGTHEAIGLPALCIALTSRSAPVRLLAILGVAPAVAAERIRSRLRWG